VPEVINQENYSAFIVSHGDRLLGSGHSFYRRFGCRPCHPWEAIAMATKAAALIKSAGKEKAFAEISDQKNINFHDRDLYVYVYDMNGVALAHGNNPKMVGKNLLELKDQKEKR
jgi:hypothetical protein